MTKEELEPLIALNLSKAKIAKRLNVKIGKVVYALKKLGLKTNIERYTTKKKKCKICGELDINKFYKDRKNICIKCKVDESNGNVRDRKQEFVDYKGGKCVICGYNKCLGAFDFHHRDPNEKDLNLSKMTSRCFDSVKIELDKCDLLCANCHREIHYKQPRRLKALSNNV